MPKLCEYCRGSLSQDDKFCPHCGAAVVEKVDPLVKQEEVEVSPSEETPSINIEEPVEVSNPKLEKEVRKKRKRPMALILVILFLLLVTRCMGKEDKPIEPDDDPEEVVITEEEPEPDDSVETQDEVTTGWVDRDGGRYYLDEAGKPLTDWYKIDEEVYYFDDQGLMQVGRLSLDGDIFLFDDQGRLVYGLNEYKGDSYFSSEEGLVQTGWQQVGAKKYYFDEDGRQLKGGQGLVDFKRDPKKGLTITSQIIDEAYLYTNLETSEEPKLSSAKSYFEFPKIEGPGNFVKTAEDLINEGHFEYAFDRWQLIKEDHEARQLYELGYVTLFNKNVRVFDSGDVSTVIIRQDEEYYNGADYMSFATAFFIDNYSGELLSSREQIESLGEDPEKVLETVRKVVNYQLGGGPGSFVEGPITGEKGSFEDRYNKGEITFTSPMEDIDNELVFLLVEDGEVYISAFVFYEYIEEDELYSYPVIGSSTLIRIPLDYKGPVQRIYENSDFYEVDHSGLIERDEAKPFSGIFDIYHFIYE